MSGSRSRKKLNFPIGYGRLFVPILGGADDESDAKESADNTIGSSPAPESLIIDLKMLPSFQATKDNLDECVHESSEAPLQKILAYLNKVELEGGIVMRIKAADRVIKELNGLIISLAQYKHGDSHLVITKVKEAVLAYASPILQKTKNLFSQPYFKPAEAKILPDLFMDFQNAFMACAATPKSHNSSVSRSR